jgi:hypothetical protein
MSWFVAWAIAEGTRRSNPRLCPESFTKWLEKNQTRACSPDDPDDKGPGASTGRGWNTVRAQVLSARAMHMEISSDSTGVVDVLAVLRGVAGLGVGVGFRAVTAAPASAGGVLVDPCVLNPRAPFCPQPSGT